MLDPGRANKSALSIAIVSVSDVAGGAEAHTVALGHGLRERGHEVALYGQCPGWEERGLPRRAIRLGPKWSRATLASGVLRMPVERRRARDVPRSSLFYAQFKREQIALTRPLSRKGPVVWTEHGRWLGGPAGRLLLRAYGRAARHVSKIICVSEAVAADVARVVDPARIVVVPNAVDTHHYAPPSAERRAALRERLLPDHVRDRPVAILAARLHPNKRHDRAMAAAQASGSALLILGEGPGRAALERLATGRADVLFLGQHDDVRDYLAASDYYLYCGSPSDGMPTAVLEAAATGLPIVGFRGDPGVELVERCGGLLLDGPAQLRTNRLPALLESRGRGAAVIERHHGLGSWLDAYEHVFRECAG